MVTRHIENSDAVNNKVGVYARAPETIIKTRRQKPRRNVTAEDVILNLFQDLFQSWFPTKFAVTSETDPGSGSGMTIGSGSQLIEYLHRE